MNGNIKDTATNICGALILLCTVATIGIQSRVLPDSWQKYIAFVGGSATALVGYYTGKGSNGDTIK